MLPTILPGSMVIARENPPYQVGDIVAFEQRAGSAKQIIVHRIVDHVKGGWIMKGDNNSGKDAGVHQDNAIKGRLILAAPYVGDTLSLLRNPTVLIITGVILGFIEIEQARRKKKKEKLRRIRLGLTAQEAKPPQLVEKKPKKSNYALFFAAISFNIITFVSTQYFISSNIKPEGDVVTGFLYNIFEPSNASTIIFALYFVFILALYFLAKVYDFKYSRKKLSTNRKSKSSIRLLLGKELNPMLALASFLWFMFILMSIFHLLSMWTDLATVFL